ncbi:MAG: hypothetical protein ACRCX8_16670 [Sarcina sp.]
MKRTLTLEETVRCYGECITSEYKEAYNLGLGLINKTGLEVKDQAVVLVLSREQFKSGLLAVGIVDPYLSTLAGGITIPMQLDGVVFPLIFICSELSDLDKEGLLVHEFTHALQLNRMGLLKYVNNTHKFKGFTAKYFTNKLEREAYWNQLKYIIKTKLNIKGVI